MNNLHDSTESVKPQPLQVELVGGPLCGTVLEWPLAWVGQTVRVSYCKQRASAAYEHKGPRHAYFVPNTLVYTATPPTP